MTITYEIHHTTELKLLKIKRQIDELMNLSSSTAYGFGIDLNKLDKMDDKLEFLLSVPFTEKKYKQAQELFKSPIRQQIARKMN